ncbi:hypothetical protein AC578_6872 [Pseudocercospora eumusae]|uniref:Uncharacterized protein n=1 Tax=Pseudocercospora eumusae TaxID=321146 RepID=A0A139H9X5_9PEZI|nr:hypothetical protein AC578_6872 [Pseudocercospora eumusae]KXS99242.1 hypothetical protein AC578_6872 [Pseudocercospora eumusae]
MASQSHELFPRLECCTKWMSDETIHDVKFYPYATEDDDQIFAFTGCTDTVVCRPKRGADPPFEVLKCFRDKDADCAYNSLAWTKCPETGTPWLCIAGAEPKHIKILNIDTGKPVRCLTGHGKGINDLAVSPLSTHLLASCAEDATIRLWSLAPRFGKQPCVALFAGAGNRAPILAIHFHPNGKWLLSGGIDTAVCLWAVPALDELERAEDSSRASEPLIVYYPHFFSKELHPNYVDCFAFYGDLILSKAARGADSDKKKGGKLNEILLWKIEGFDSDKPPPEDPPIPEPAQQTRSSFPHNEGFRGFRRLLTFKIPHTDRFYHRFGLLHAPNVRPILCMGNQESQYLFWDMQRLEEGIDPQDRPVSRAKKRGKQRKGTALLGDLQGRSESVAGSSSRGTPEASTTTAADEREYTLGDAFLPLEAHESVTANTKLSAKTHFATAQIAWSPDATTMVGVGDRGMICMFYRDKSVVRTGIGREE